MEYKNFGSIIKYNPEGHRFDGVVVGASQDLTFSGKSIGELKTNFEAVVDKHLDRCAAKAIEPYQVYSGKLLIRVDRNLHRSLAIAAQADNISVNKWIEAALADCIARRR